MFWWGENRELWVQTRSSLALWRPAQQPSHVVHHVMHHSLKLLFCCKHPISQNFLYVCCYTCTFIEGMYYCYWWQCQCSCFSDHGTFFFLFIYLFIFLTESEKEAVLFSHVWKFGMSGSFFRFKFYDQIILLLHHVTISWESTTQHSCWTLLHYVGGNIRFCWGRIWFLPIVLYRSILSWISWTGHTCASESAATRSHLGSSL